MLESTFFYLGRKEKENDLDMILVEVDGARLFFRSLTSPLQELRNIFYFFGLAYWL